MPSPAQKRRLNPYLSVPFVSCLLLTLYVLSVGPAAALSSHWQEPEPLRRSVVAFYSPLRWLRDHTPLGEPLDWYRDLWR